jgi:release factor glutamine methyltransferase
MIASEVIKRGSKILKDKKILTYQLDSELILSKLLNKRRENLLVNEETIVPLKTIKNFNKLIKIRSKRQPIAYILNKKEFWNYIFYVNKYTLIPRPETELMVESVLKIYKSKRFKILDIGTGSGCILLSILAECKKASGTGLDISKNALKVAKKNAKLLDLSLRSKFVNKSISDYFPGKFDLIVSNPPYIKSPEMFKLPPDVKNFEPNIALNGGNDGLDVIKKVIYKSRSILKLNGILAIEIGNKQYKKVSQILKKNNFREKLLIKDYRENIRCVFSIMQG